MTRPRSLSARKTLWSVVVYRPKPRLVALFETKAEADLAAKLVESGSVLPPVKAWACEEAHD
jgi:hypothetical protein